MAVTVNLYNHSAKKFGNGEWAGGDTYKVMLLDASGTFTATNTVIGDVSANEVTSTEWVAGGETLASVAVTTVTTNDGKFDATDISVTATSDPIGPTLYAVIYNVTDTSALVAHINFDGSKTADTGTDFKITWHADGIFTWTVT